MEQVYYILIDYFGKPSESHHLEWGVSQYRDHSHLSSRFPMRCAYGEPFNNPFSVVLITGSLLLLALGFQSKFVQNYDVLRDVP